VGQIQTAPQGSSTWTTIGTLTIPAGVTTEQVLTLAVEQAIGGKIRMNFTSVGSTTPASKPVVEVLTSAVAA